MCYNYGDDQECDYVKKILFFFIALFLSITTVMAAELPDDSFAYFMTYPNGLEIGTGSYEEAISNEERLIYTGYTDSNGQITLEGWESEGEIRIEYLSNRVSTSLSQNHLN